MRNADGVLLREHYDNCRSLTWIELPRNEWLLVAVNYCFIVRMNDVSYFWDSRRIRYNHTNNSNGEYIFNELIFHPAAGRQITEDDRKFIEDYINKFEDNMRDVCWGKGGSDG